ncbi:hypothetical protein [Streptomyces sp. SP18CS02]|nr:hypothetical protein [Streptomyces sp. SP18CS02]MEE1752124.1 hypothetical protein [Streptomyces sp. SP18CS02]
MIDEQSCQSAQSDVRIPGTSSLTTDRDEPVRDRAPAARPFDAVAGLRAA